MVPPPPHRVYRVPSSNVCCCCSKKMKIERREWSRGGRAGSHKTHNFRGYQYQGYMNIRYPSDIHFDDDSTRLPVPRPSYERPVYVDVRWYINGSCSHKRKMLPQPSQRIPQKCRKDVILRHENRISRVYFWPVITIFTRFTMLPFFYMFLFLVYVGVPQLCITFSVLDPALALLLTYFTLRVELNDCENIGSYSMIPD